MLVKFKQGQENEYFDLDKEYVVYALYMGKNIKLFIQSEGLPSAPSAIAIMKLIVIDGRLSRHWVMTDGHKRTDGSTITDGVLAFPEWANNEHFYSDLIEGKSDAGEIWRSNKAKMDLEFATSSILKIASKLDKNWVQCVECGDSWDINTCDEVIECPNCKAQQKV